LATEDLLSVRKLNKKSGYFNKNSLCNVVVIRATTADENGKFIGRREAMWLNSAYGSGRKRQRWYCYRSSNTCRGPILFIEEVKVNWCLVDYNAHGGHKVE